MVHGASPSYDMYDPFFNVTDGQMLTLTDHTHLQFKVF